MGNLSDRTIAVEKVPVPQSPARAGFLQPYAGSVAPPGWLLCDGAVLEQVDYPDLFVNIGNTWDTLAHPVDGTPVVGAGQFAIPNLKGLWLNNVGSNAANSYNLGSFSDEQTKVNGLAASAVADGDHTHPLWSFAGATLSGGSSNIPIWQNSANSTQPTQSAGTHGHAINLSGDNETRPRSATVNYIIKLYNDQATVAVTEAVADETTAGTIILNSTYDATPTRPGLVKTASLFAVGSVQQSFLTEAQFNAEMGGDWVLADGRPVLGSRYEAITGETNVPNVAGRFLRTVGGSAANLRGTQGFTTSATGLSIGDDSHSHGGNGSIGILNALRWAGTGVSYNFLRSSFNGSSTITDSDTHTHSISGATETRPDNISVNTFIRIN